MAIIVKWCNVTDMKPKRVIICTFSRKWTLEEFYHAAEQVSVLLGSVPHSVCVISYFPEGFNAPVGFIHTTDYLRRLITPNMKLNVVVGHNHMAKLFRDIFYRIIPDIISHVQFADSLDEAQAMCREKFITTTKKNQ